MFSKHNQRHQKPSKFNQADSEVEVIGMEFIEGSCLGFNHKKDEDHCCVVITKGKFTQNLEKYPRICQCSSALCKEESYMWQT